MSNEISLPELTENSEYRRIWLLCKALETEPLGRAIEIARAADEFVTGTGIEESAVQTNPAIDAAVLSRCEHEQSPGTAMDAAEVNEPSESPARIRLSAEQRERLIERLAAGAKNAELAAELGLSSKQVQGFRMGSAREIANRREHLEGQKPGDAATSTDEVIRYLRQQDDVVVPQGEGEYLINGRFQLSISALVDRANRMRSRQGKPHFKLPGHAQREHIAVANGHSAF
jgi:hypothetical protein